jgi:cytochrome c oxidase assembly protein subunit 11
MQVGVIETTLSRYVPVIGTLFCVTFAVGLVNWVHQHAWGGAVLVFSGVLLMILLGYALWSVARMVCRWQTRFAMNRMAFWGVAMASFGIAMFGFSYLLVPLYDVICKHMGVNGHVGHTAKQIDAHHLVHNHPVKLQMVANVNSELPWDVIPIERNQVIKPGESITLHYYVRNRAAHSVTVRPVLSLTPSELAQFFMRQQAHNDRETRSLAAGESALWSMTFRLSDKVPANVGELTLAYSLFDVAYVGHLGRSHHWQKMRRMTRGVETPPKA